MRVLETKEQNLFSAVWIFALIAVIAAFFLFNNQSASAEGAGSVADFPWKVGETIAKDWRIAGLKRHEEYVRLQVTRGTESTEIEITFAKQPGSLWEVGKYRLQPAPGASPPQDLLKEVFAELGKLAADSSTKNAPLVRKHDPPVPNIAKATVLHELDDKAREFFNLGALYLFIVALALVLALKLGFCWMHLDKTLHWLMPSLLITIALVVLAFWLFLPAKAIPIDWITVMHEGQGRDNILQIYGHGAHTGQAYHKAIDFFLPESPSALHDLVWFNLLMSCINAMIFLVMARHITHTFWLALPLAVIFMFNQFSISSSLSELPSQSLTFFVLLGTSAVGLYHHRFAAKRDKRAAALLLILVSTLAVLTRSEFALLAMTTLAMLLPQERFGPEWAKRFWARICGAVISVLGWPRRKIALSAALVLVGLFIFGYFSELTNLSSPFMVLRLFNLAFLTSPFVLGSLLSAGSVFLILLGLSHSFRHAARFLLLPITLLLMYNLYSNVSHGTYFEIIRYLTYIVSLFFVLALFGWREIKWIAARMRWPIMIWRPIAITLLVLLFFASPSHLRYRDFGHPINEDDLPFFNLSRNQQMASRYLLASVESNPDCTFVAKVIRERNRDDYELLFFGAGFPKAIAVPYNDEPISQMVQRHVPENRRCVLFYYGLDCNRISYDSCELAQHGIKPENCKHVTYKRCEQEHQGMTLFDETSFRSRPYSNEEEFGFFAPKVDLRLYWVPKAGN